MERLLGNGKGCFTGVVGRRQRQGLGLNEIEAWRMGFLMLD